MTFINCPQKNDIAVYIYDYTFLSKIINKNQQKFSY